MARVKNNFHASKLNPRLYTHSFMIIEQALLRQRDYNIVADISSAKPKMRVG
jgi:hypothetical protein